MYQINNLPVSSFDTGIFIVKLIFKSTIMMQLKTFDNHIIIMYFIIWYEQLLLIQ